MRDPVPWYAGIRAISDESFGYPWQPHLARLNARYGLTGPRRFVTHAPSVPPPWFNGDIERVQPGSWVLMVSLNPRVNPADSAAIAWYDAQHFTPGTFWRHWRRFNTDHWYPTFFRPRARLAARALGESLSPANERWFATERMLFTELCPYGSQEFSLAEPQLVELSQADIGFRLAAGVRDRLIELGHPALVIVNGNAAVQDFETLGSSRVSWRTVSYPSVEALSGRRPGRTLWHNEGTYTTATGTVPLVGCPFLRTIHGANWNSEIDQLGDNIRRFLATFSAPETRCSSPAPPPPNPSGSTSTGPPSTSSTP